MLSCRVQRLRGIEQKWSLTDGGSDGLSCLVVIGDESERGLMDGRDGRWMV